MASTKNYAIVAIIAALMLSAIAANNTRPSYTGMAVWWNDSFPYRQEIASIENPGKALRDYQIMAEINTAELIQENKMNQDCSDARFLDSNLKELKYYIEDSALSQNFACNTTTTRVWINLPMIQANGREMIYLYSGNPSATSMSNSTRVFEPIEYFQNNNLSETDKITALTNGRWDFIKDSTNDYSISFKTRMLDKQANNNFKANNNAAINNTILINEWLGITAKKTGNKDPTLEFYYNNGTILQIIKTTDTAYADFNRTITSKEYNVSTSDIRVSKYTDTLAIIYMAGKKNNPPTVWNVTLSSTSGSNLTTDNLTVTFTTSDTDRDAVYNITDWRINSNSIAVLNLPFDATNNRTKDFSTYSQNVSEENSPSYKPIGGIIGGAYDFSANDDDLSIVDSASLDITGKITLEAWVNIRRYSNWDGIISKPWNAGSEPFVIYSLGLGNNSNFAMQLTSNGTRISCFSAPNSAVLGVWTHVVGMWNGSSVSLYANGNKSDQPCELTGVLDVNNENLTVGGYKYGTTYDFNGRIDNVRVYGRALSEEQIRANYNNGNPNYALIASHETSVNENWTVAITPADKLDIGATKLSNNILIRAINDPPARVQLYFPFNDSSSPITLPTFIWYNSTDLDGDPLTYGLQVAEDYNFLSLNTNKTGIAEGGNTTNYTQEQDLNARTGYYWRVRAYDGTNYGEWSETRSYYVEPLLSFTLLVGAIDFGMIENNESKNTTSDSPLPFIIENTGNVVLNISVKATSPLWFNALLNSSNLRFKADDRNETNAFDKTTSQMSFTNVVANAINALTKLNYTDKADTGVIDLDITSPTDEPAGSKSTTFIFTGEEAA